MHSNFNQQYNPPSFGLIHGTGGRCLGSRQKQKPPIAGGGEVKRMKQITLRIPEELYTELGERADKINISTHSIILLLVHLGLKIYDGKAVIQVEE